MKNKIKLIIILLIIVITIVINVVIFLLLGNEKTDTKSYTKKEIVERISKGIKNGISKKELEELMNQEVMDTTMMTGEDAYLLQTPNEKIIDKDNLDSYVKENKKYFANLEKKIKENYSWEFDGEAEENQDTYFVNVKTYQYGVYLTDVEEIVNILTQNYPFENAEDQEVNNYKAKVIAMKLLDSHLDDYISNSEPRTIAIFFTSIDSQDTKDSLSQYVIDLSGYASGSDDRINNMEINRTQRMQEYINSAINNGILDKNDILKI